MASCWMRKSSWDLFCRFPTVVTVRFQTSSGLDISIYFPFSPLHTSKRPAAKSVSRGRRLFSPSFLIP